MSTSVPWAHGARGLAIQADIDRREQRALVITAGVATNEGNIATNEDSISKLAAIIEALVDVNARVELDPDQSAELHALAGEHSVFVAPVTAPAP